MRSPNRRVFGPFGVLRGTIPFGMWRVLRLSSRGGRWLSSSATPSTTPSAADGRLHEDDGDWSYASEWWHEPGSPAGHTVFRSQSEVGNGIVSVVAFPSSRPALEQWPATERWLQERYAKMHPEFDNNGQFKILGYQWRALQFNDSSRQSTVKIMAAYRKCDPGSLYMMQQPNCLPVPYLKSMLSAGLTTLSSLRFDILSAASGRKTLHILCIGHGGGNLPLFLANKIQGAVVDVVEIDPLVISASIQAMGFPASALKEAATTLNSGDDLLWEGTHERLFLHNLAAEHFILNNNTNLYDLVLIDAYDGDDIFPRRLWDPDSAFMKALGNQLHPDHGTVVVNLHADSDISAPGRTEYSGAQSILPMGKYVSQVARAYKEHIGMAFTVSVPHLCNSSLVAFRNIKGGPLSSSRDSILGTLVSRSNFVEYVLDLPFPCFHYIMNDFVLVD